MNVFLLTTDKCLYSIGSLHCKNILTIALSSELLWTWIHV